MEVVAGTALKFLKKNHLSIEFSTTFVLLHKIHDNPFWSLSYSSAVQQRWMQQWNL